MLTRAVPNGKEVLVEGAPAQSSHSRLPRFLVFESPEWEQLTNGISKLITRILIVFKVYGQENFNFSHCMHALNSNLAIIWHVIR